MPPNEKLHIRATILASIACCLFVVGSSLLADSGGIRGKDGALHNTIGAYGVFPSLFLGLIVGHVFRLFAGQKMRRDEFVTLAAVSLALILTNAAYLVPLLDAASARSSTFLLFSVPISWVCCSSMLLLAGNTGRWSSGITNDGSGQKTEK